MTREERVTVEPEDIATVAVVCRCGARVSLPVYGDHLPRTPEKCPLCGTSWLVRGGGDAVERLISAIRAAGELADASEGRFRFALELDPDA